MICYRDMSFCESDCLNQTCPRLLTDKVKADARKWWGEDGAPIATADFSKNCKDYLSDDESKHEYISNEAYDCMGREALP